MKKIVSLALALALSLAMAACGGNNATPSNSPAPPSPGMEPSSGSVSAPGEESSATILIAAAASLELVLRDRLIPAFREQHPGIAVEGSYDSSGKIQRQIEEGLPADLFLSAAQAQMDALVDQGLVDRDSVLPLLENELVLIVPTGQENAISSFEELPRAGQVAIGDPDSVPAGQYAREVLVSLGLWEALTAAEARLSLGSNVTEVLNWVAEGSADAGIVYATDAATTDRVTVVARAPEGSLATRVIYPAGVVSSSRHKEAAALFLDFLQSEEAIAAFGEYGFLPA